MKTVVMKPYLSYLPDNNNNNYDEIRNSFIDTFLDKLKKQDKKRELI